MNSCAFEQPSPAGHVALFMPSLGGGGAERSMLNLAAGLLDANFRVDLLLASAVGPYLAQVPDSLRIIDFGAGRIRNCFPGMVRYLRDNHPQILLSTPFRANIVAILSKELTRSRVRVFVREAATLSESLRNDTSWQAWQALLVARFVYPRADGIVAVSAGVAHDLQMLLKLDPSKLKVINNPVVNRDFQLMAAESVDHPWFKPGMPPVVIGVGRLAPQKDFATLIRAFARVRRQINCHLMILGEGPEREALEALVRSLQLDDEVALPGFLANPFPYMRMASLLVLSSRHEGLPNVLIQAMALGTPVIATDCPSGPAEILDQGRFGPLIAIGDVNALTGAMAEMLMAEPCDAVRQKLQERAGIYHVDKVLPEYIDFFFPNTRKVPANISTTDHCCRRAERVS